jgi:hypothetical protein
MLPSLGGMQTFEHSGQGASDLRDDNTVRTTLQYRPVTLYALCVHMGTGILPVAVIDRIV